MEVRSEQVVNLTIRRRLGLPVRCHVIGSGQYVFEYEGCVCVPYAETDCSDIIHSNQNEATC